MHLFSAGTAVLLSPFRREMLEMSQMWFTVHVMTTFEIALIAPRAGCIWYHLWCKDPIIRGVKLDVIPATMSFPLFSFSCSCYSPFYILFLTCILDVFWNTSFVTLLLSELLLYLYIGYRFVTGPNTNPQLLLSLQGSRKTSIRNWWRTAGPSRFNKCLVWIWQLV